MIRKLKDYINAIRLNYVFEKRKTEIAKSIDKTTVKHLERTISINHLWYGNSYGGFFIHPDVLTKNSIIYSIGIGKDVSFDKKCMETHGCRVFGFDPTPKSIDFIKRHKVSKLFNFHPYGISSDSSGEVDFFLPKNPNATSGSLLESDDVSPDNKITVKMKTLEDMMKDLNHSHIDVLKMDIEGAEYEVLEQIIDAKVPIKQILVEFHDRLFEGDRLKSELIIRKLKANNYEIFGCSETFEEISLIQVTKN